MGDNTKLRLYMTVKKTQSLGPFNRYGIWVQGCLKKCTGCISEDAQSLAGGYEVGVPVLAREILNTPDIEGITISGGEPFLQSAALVELIELIKNERDLGIIVYTGMNYDEIENDSLSKLCDITIDGDYIESLNDGLSLRGSSNQIVIMLTNRYVNKLSLYGAKGRKIELHFINDRVTMVGIPDKKSLAKLLGKKNNREADINERN